MIAAKELYDQLAPGYDAHFQRPIDFAENKVIFGMLPGLNGRILDLGCGTGLYLEYCNPGNRYIGLDSSPGMLEIARSKFPGRPFLEGFMEDLREFQEKSFDVVLSTFGSFSYCLEPQRAIEEIWRVLKPGGQIFIMAYSKRYENRRSYIAGNKVPITIWKPETLYQAFQQFAALKVQGMSGLGEVFSEWFPQWFLDWYTRIEMHVLGYRWPALFYNYVVTGIKPNER